MNIDFCPFGKYNKDTGITDCTIRPVGDTGFSPCVRQAPCHVYQTLVKINNEAYANGIAYERLCQQERLRSQ